MCFEVYVGHRDLHVRTPSCPTRRSSYLLGVYTSGLPGRVAVSSARRRLLRAGSTRRIGRLGAPLTLRNPAKLNSISTGAYKIGREHVCTPVTNAHIVCRLLLEKTNTHSTFICI